MQVWGNPASQGIKILVKTMKEKKKSKKAIITDSEMHCTAQRFDETGDTHKDWKLLHLKMQPIYIIFL